MTIMGITSIKLPDKLNEKLQDKLQDKLPGPIARLPKAALIAIAVALVALLVIVLIPRGGFSDLKGSYELIVVTTDGADTYIDTEAAGGSLEISGKTWTMVLRTPDSESTFTGKIKFDTKEKTSDGTVVYIYDFTYEGGGSFKAGFIPSNEMVTISTQSYMDLDNCATFRKIQEEAAEDFEE